MNDFRIWDSTTHSYTDQEVFINQHGVPHLPVVSNYGFQLADASSYLFVEREAPVEGVYEWDYIECLPKNSQSVVVGKVFFSNIELAWMVRLDNSFTYRLCEVDVLKVMGNVKEGMDDDD